MRLSRQLEEALQVPTPYQMHVKHGMELSPEFITKGRKGVEAKGPRLFLSRDGEKWVVEARVKGRKAIKKSIDKKREAYKLARRYLLWLRDYGDDFVVNTGKRTWRVKGGDTMAFAAAQQGVQSFFKKGGP